MGTVAVRLAGARKSYAHHGTPVLDGVDLEITAGESLVILGPSGSGKSTLLRIIAGLDRLDGGSIGWGEGRQANPATGMVFQQPLLMPWLTVRDNVRFGGRFARHRGDFDPAAADALLERFGLAGLADRMPDQLSGGQAQRVAVMRAVAVRPRLLLLDEPFSALDPAVRADLQDWLATLVADLGCTTVLVTHDVDEALRLGDRIVLIGHGGTVRAQFPRPTSDDERNTLRHSIIDRYRDMSVPV
ncbi:nitrate ABC transporter ATP-binding protein [Nocardia nova]|uniref:Nitrate ABC transporter ATP-binding protein n=1 Tax=Nocardia nova TaxID=37330 RepID=A0A2S6AKA2_9NOCA|nr:ABC transporter ATP-binding protein [Nocardia nova]PPJ24893.1 nitrate ABC transporter ATP-binding protein [Nocardia nova]PPJ35655.1 nitrate ABC transporter ATP-binding protein [Nocardia nova]